MYLPGVIVDYRGSLIQYCCVKRIAQQSDLLCALSPNEFPASLWERVVNLLGKLWVEKTRTCEANSLTKSVNCTEIMNPLNSNFQVFRGAGVKSTKTILICSFLWNQKFQYFKYCSTTMGLLQAHNNNVYRPGFCVRYSSVCL